MKKEDCCEINEAALNLIKENEKMLWKNVHMIKIYPTYMGKEDLYQDFVAVLLECIKTYDPSKNAKFSTHLYWQLRSKKSKIITKMNSEYRYKNKLRKELVSFSSRRRKAKSKIRPISIYNIVAGFKPINARRKKLEKNEKKLEESV